MGQFTRNIKRKKGIEERKQQAKEHRNQTDFLDERKKNYTQQQQIEEKTEILLKIPLFISVTS